ncbi:MAG: restriction endonuclease subunit S, partial [Collinsella tanakaei]
AQLDKLDLLVKSRFVEMFGDPVLNPMRWSLVELSYCLSKIDNGKSLVCDAKSRQGNWPAILKLSAVTYGDYQPEENKAMLHADEFVDNAEVRSGDLLFTRKNTPELVGMCAYVYETPVKLMMPDLIFRLNTNEKCNSIFLWKLINHDLFRENIKAISSGSAKSMSNISKERLRELKIILPPIELQQQFAHFVKKTDQSKLTINKSLDKLEMAKNAIMQQYFG